jgi:calcium-dependent protein kinase
MFTQHRSASPEAGKLVKGRALSIQENLVRIQDDYRRVYDKYEVLDEIGVGSMGSVYKVRIKHDKLGGSAYHPRVTSPSKRRILHLWKRKNSTKPDAQLEGEHQFTVVENGDADDDKSRYVYALKTIRLDRSDESFETFLEEMKNEVAILRSMDHPNIVKAHEVFITKTSEKDRQICIVLELCSGGDLYDRLPYTEREAARIVEKLLNAVVYMHSRGVVHRDLKFENIMFLDSTPSSEIKILDFGLSKMFQQKEIPGYMSDRVGTIYTMAPEVLDGPYSKQADLWSIGVISYMLLASKKPFYNKNMKKMKALIHAGNPSYDNAVWSTLSPDAKEFVQKLLQLNPVQRMTIEQALQHPFIVRRELLSDELPSPEVYQMIEYGLMNYTMHTPKLKKLALTVIAHDSNSEDVDQLRKAFIRFDTERNGILSFEEFKSALMQNIQHKYTEDELEATFESMVRSRPDPRMNLECEVALDSSMMAL